VNFYLKDEVFRLRNDLFYVGWGVKHHTSHTSHTHLKDGLVVEFTACYARRIDTRGSADTLGATENAGADSRGGKCRSMQSDIIH